MLWIDFDREGENIGFEVLDICKSVNKNLTVYRAHFSSLVPAEIKNACQHLTPPNKNLSDAVDARQELDLRIGAAFTRFQTKRFQRKFVGLEDELISYGPCQFPTLGFVVSRFWEIENFVPEKFWSIRLEIKRDGAVASFAWERVKVFDHDICTLLLEDCVSAKTGIIVKVDAKSKRKYRPLPLTTVELQKNAARRLHVTSDEVMSIAESLYRRGFISYPRTETDRFPSGFNFKELIDGQGASNSPWAAYARELSGGKFRMPRNGTHDDKAHPAIHPTKPAPPGTLGGKEASVYEFITRRFLACCSDDALGQITTVFLKQGGEFFRCSGEMVIEQNYLAVYVYDKWSDKSIPRFQTGERVVPTVLEMRDGTTTPPELLREEDLISLMDKNGIGTDATIAEHIKKVQERHYVEVTPQGRFAPTILGIALVEGYDALGVDLSRPHLRALTEVELAKITQGAVVKQEVVDNALAAYRGIFTKVREGAHVLDEKMSLRFESSSSKMEVEAQHFVECGKCHGMMDIRTAGRGDKAGRVLYCPGCQTSLSLPLYTEIAATQQRCACCGFYALKIAKEATAYHICPNCFNNPAVESVSAPRCFMCANPDCPLAEKRYAVPVMKCVCGQGSLVPKKTKTGAFLLSCDAYPACSNALWFPKELQEIAVLGDVCPRCSARGETVHLVKLVLPSSFGGAPETVVGCVNKGCDHALDQRLSQNSEYSIIERFWSRAESAASHPPASRAPARTAPQGSAAARGGNGSGAYRGTAHTASRAPVASGTTAQSTARCFRCNKVGHYANNCPELAGRSRTAAATTTAQKRQREPAGSSTAESARQRTCSVCHQPGHTKRTCPLSHE